MLNKNFLLDMFFPKFCLSCRKEGEYLCQDCKAMLDISGFHQKYKTQNLSDLYYPLSYQNKFIQNIIKKFKYEPFVKELGHTLAILIIEHFELLDQNPDFLDPVRNQKSSNGAGFILIPVPLEKKRLKWRGYNQSEEIGKHLAEFFKVILVGDVLLKIKTTLPQIELAKEKREKNVTGAFLINPSTSLGARDPDLIRGKKILLVDDVYTTGATMEECALTLKRAGAKEIIGIVVARG